MVVDITTSSHHGRYNRHTHTPVRGHFARQEGADRGPNGRSFSTQLEKKDWSRPDRHRSFSHQRQRLAY